MMFRFLSPLFALILAGCAGQRLPEGGPIDTTPPEIVSVYPEPGTTHFADNKIAFEFSEYVDRRSVEESIFISPSVGEMEFDWSGREVEVTFGEKLKDSATYVVTVGTDVQDVHNHNRMAHAFSLAFSTGEHIDRGMIEGKLYDEKPDGVMIFAYRLDGINPDTLNPVTMRPDFITQTGRSGQYSLSHLAFGTYRLIAVRDEFRNLLYDPEADAVGTAFSDIRLTERDTIKGEIDFQLSKEDTTAPRLLSAVAPDNRHVVLAFSEEIDSSTVSTSSFAIIDTLQQSSLRISDFFVQLNKRSIVTLSTAPQVRNTIYRAEVRGVKDMDGHVIHPLAFSKTFLASLQPDTAAPHLLFAQVADSTYAVSLNEQLRFDFDDVLQKAPAAGAFQLINPDSSLASVSVRWVTPASLFVVPKVTLLPNSRYRIRIRLDSIRDMADNRLKDSTRSFVFRTVDPEKFGSIEGTLIDFDTTHSASYVVLAKSVTNNRLTPAKAAVKSGENFRLLQLPEGRYSVEAFQDLNGNQQLDTGRPFPFFSSERFVIYGDTIKVRARWPVEGVIIRMK